MYNRVKEMFKLLCDYFQIKRSSFTVEIGAFSFCTFIVREPPISFFFQSFKKMILFVLKNIVHFSSISFVFSVNDRPVFRLV